MKHQKLQQLVTELYSIVHQFEQMFPGRHFTPDGHMVGSLGECLVADAYDLQLMPASNKGYDASDKFGRKIEIKATQSTSVAFRSRPDYAIVIKILIDGTFEECFNGPGKLIWETFSEKQLPSNGQFSITLGKLKNLNQRVCKTDRIAPSHV